MMHYRNDGNPVSNFTTDIRQSTTTVLDSNANFLTGFRYTDFGETTRLANTYELIEIAYTGGVWDESTGLYYLNARFYNPVDARFLTMDVARSGGDLRATLSLYGYTEGDPINKVDPSGYVAIAVIPVGMAVGSMIKAAAISAAAVVVVGGATWVLSNQIGRIRNRQPNAHYFRARLSSDRRHVLLGSRMRRGQAVTRLRNGNDVITSSRARARRIARRASPVNRAQFHHPHTANNRNRNPMRHYHPARNSVRNAQGNFKNLMNSHAWWR